MKIEQFEDILGWQKDKRLTLRIYAIFRNSRDYGFKDQVCRASVSILNNIAEGFERK
jgi:four helix bundle protein